MKKKKLILHTFCQQLVKPERLAINELFHFLNFDYYSLLIIYYYLSLILIITCFILICLVVLLLFLPIPFVFKYKLN